MGRLPSGQYVRAEIDANYKDLNYAAFRDFRLMDRNLMPSVIVFWHWMQSIRMPIRYASSRRVWSAWQSRSFSPASCAAWTDFRGGMNIGRILQSIIGHYWRCPTAAGRDAHSRGEPDLFQDHAVRQWLGARGTVFCVDFAVGARYKERVPGRETVFECRLAAVQWPERRLVFDDSPMFNLTAGSAEALEEVA
jgi:hypothetical protein